MGEFAQKVRELLDEVDKAQEASGIVSINRPGRKFEKEFLGFTLPDEDDLYFEPKEYVSFRDALAELAKSQPDGYNPHNPSGGCNAKFFASVLSFLSCRNDELAYYIATGSRTKMDFFHGTDAVFLWRNVTATIDVTVDPEKGFKADFLIMPADVESGEVYGTIAEKIASMLMDKYIRRFNHSRAVSVRTEI